MLRKKRQGELVNITRLLGESFCVNKARLVQMATAVEHEYLEVDSYVNINIKQYLKLD